MSSTPILNSLMMGFAILVALAIPASAQPTFENLGTWLILDLSADGSVGVGQTNDGLAEAVRWTASDGVVRLGRSSVAMTGRGGGTVGVSADGLRVTGSIGTSDSLYVTQGRWTKGLGWEETMPPLGPDGNECDDNLGSAWAISGDGETVVGLYWVTACRAHASAWTSSGGLVDLGSQGPGANSRANDVNYDGSVVVGWSSGLTTGAWQPTVWENGVLTVLVPSEASNEASVVSSDGTMIAGSSYDDGTGQNPSTLWIKTESGWQQNTIGVLPGTIAGYGKGYPQDMSADGTIIVGLNRYDWFSGTGFVWTLEQGLMSAADYFASIGAPIPEGWVIQGLTGVSADGSVVAGYGYDGLTPGSPQESFIVNKNTATDAPPVLEKSSMILRPAHPNPFNPSTTLSLVLDRDDFVSLDIFDSRGRIVRSLYNGPMTAGTHQLMWDGRDDSGATVVSGIYLARAEGESGLSDSQKLTLVK